MDSKRIAGGVVSFVGLALAGEWIIRGADMVLGLFYDGTAVDWSSVRTAIGLAVLPVGLYFMLRPSTKSGREREIEQLCELAKSILFQHSAFTGDARPPIRGEIASLYLGLKKLGFSTPDHELSDVELVIKRADHFISAIFPMIRDGHVKEAQRESARLADAADKAVPTNFRRIVALKA